MLYIWSSDVKKERSMAITAGTVPAGSTAQWKDNKRYLWLIGLVVPSLAFIAFGMFQLTGWSVWLWIGADHHPRRRPRHRPVRRPRPLQPARRRDRARWRSDKYYRWITYVFLPIQYVGFLGAFIWIAKPEWLGVAELSTFDKIGIAISIGAHRRHRHQHRPRARPQEGEPRALAVQDRAGAELLRPLLHRAQPRPPRPRRDARGPGEQPARRELLPVLAAHGRSAR